MSGEEGIRPNSSADGKKLFYRTDDASGPGRLRRKAVLLTQSGLNACWKLGGGHNQPPGVDSNRDRFLLISEEVQGERSHHLALLFDWFEKLRQLMETRQ
ncbi:MAG TPA: hypothetical protein VMY18_13540 [Acidobacteriota bacterium]|nr:hypothetical protein [Acidobacteriota bacterium]